VDKNENLLEIAQAEQSLQSFGETVQCLRNNIFQVMQQGEQLAQVRARVRVKYIAGKIQVETIAVLEMKFVQFSTNRCHSI